MNRNDLQLYQFGAKIILHWKDLRILQHFLNWTITP